MKNCFPYHLHYIAGACYEAYDESDKSGDSNGGVRKRNYISVHHHDKTLIYNFINGNIISYNLDTDEQYVLNMANSKNMRDMFGFAFDDNYYYLADESSLKMFDKNFTISKELRIPEPADSLTVDGDLIYTYNDESFTLSISRISFNEITLENKFTLPGIGKKKFSIKGEELWVVDDEENTIYVLDKFTGKQKFSMITPFVFPNDLCFIGEDIFVIYGGLSTVTSYDNSSWPQQKPFLHRLRYEIKQEGKKKYVLTNPFIVELTYEETIKLVNEKDSYDDLKLKISLPVENERQKLLNIKAFGQPFEISEENGTKQAVFNLGHIDDNSGGVIGYKAMMKLYGIKYIIDDDVNITELAGLSEDILFEATDHEGIGIESPVIKEFAGENPYTHIIESIKHARNKVFDALYYKPNPDARTLGEVLTYGYGTCGDYSSLIMAICKRYNIPIRSVGGFKVGRFTNSQYEMLPNYFNHAWLDVFVPGHGWLPFESSSDHKKYGDRYCEGQFLGEDWTHIKTHNNKTIPNFISCFDGDKEVYPFDICVNMIFEKVLGETEF